MHRARLTRLGLRLGYRVALILRHLGWRRAAAAVAIWHAGRVVVVSHSYRAGYGLPGGMIRHGEAPRVAACRELREELGVAVDPSQLTRPRPGFRRRSTAHLFEYDAPDKLELRPDNREVVAAHWVDPATAALLMPDLRRYLLGRSALRGQA